MHLVNKVALDRAPIPGHDLRLRAIRPEVRRNDTRIFFTALRASNTEQRYQLREIPANESLVS